jgi:hypothetical protein
MMGDGSIIIDDLMAVWRSWGQREEEGSLSSIRTARPCLQAASKGRGRIPGPPSNERGSEPVYLPDRSSSSAIASSYRAC